jgi:hypothetical protein
LAFMAYGGFYLWEGAFSGAVLELLYGLTAFVVGLYEFARVARMGARTSPNGLIVRSWVATRVAPWNQISGFSLIPARLTLGRYVCGVSLLNGGVIRVDGIRSFLGPWGSEAHEILDELEAARLLYVG